MKELYLLSGLGADKRVFEFLDLSGYHVNHIRWIDPLKDESIEKYAARLLPQIATSKPILIGVSFGGMMAIEIAKLIDTEKIILISSIKNKSELPNQLKLAGLLGLNKIKPPAFFKEANAVTCFLFGVTQLKEKKLLHDILGDTNTNFLVWGMGKIVTWKNTKKLTNITHIHGTMDRIFPISKPDFEIKGGGHLMIINRSKEIGELIREIVG